MPLRCDTFSLKSLLSDLSVEFPGVRTAFLFGSRRHRTRSTRSDVDILIEAADSVRPEDVRDFALKNCPALDFFFMEAGTAISCANGSKVRGTSNKDLIKRLDAIPLWSRAKGFVETDVDWDFEVIKGMTPVMTTLVSAAPFVSKADAVTSRIDEEPLGRNTNAWQHLKDHPVAIVVGIIVATASITFGVIHELRIAPLEQEIRELDRQLTAGKVTNAPASIPPQRIDSRLFREPPTNRIPRPATLPVGAKVSASAQTPPNDAKP